MSVNLYVPAPLSWSRANAPFLVKNTTPEISPVRAETPTLELPVFLQASPLSLLKLSLLREWIAAHRLDLPFFDEVV